MAIIRPHTITYKTVGNLDIPFDLYLPTNAKDVPLLLWLHGGGLLQGRRDWPSPHMLAAYQKHSFALISADYRLAPQVGVREVYDDVKDCVTFIRSPDGLAKHFDAGSIDTSKLAVSGSSAGGYLSLLAGLYLEPKPQVILPIYPITDPLGTFWMNPQPIPLFKPAGKTDSSKNIDRGPLEPFLDEKVDAVANNSAASARANMYFYMMQECLLPRLLHLNTEKDPYHDPENDKWRVPKALRERGLPPAYIVHGDVDRAVGIEQADEVVGVMVGLGLEVRYERLKDTDHLFDTDESVRLEEMYEFMMKHL